MSTQNSKETPNAGTPPEITPNTPGTAPTVEVVAAAPRMEKARVLRTHRTVVAGAWYDLEEGKNVDLPVDVCAILVNSGIVAKI